MDKKDIEFLLNQIRNIILNKPIMLSEHIKNEDFAVLQEAISYLSGCLSESNEFLKEIAAGNLAAKTPRRENFLAGSIKELHAGLKHLTWQASQVAQGNYNQSVSFLGEFSVAFNKMISQLKERENKLKIQSEALEQNNALMKLIMDSINDYVVVVSQENNEIIYMNKSAHKLLHNMDSHICFCDGECYFIKECINQKIFDEEKSSYKVHHCKDSDRFFYVDTFSLHWNDILAYAYRIIDVTEDFKEKSMFENMAYKDELTGLYNRRYCVKKMEKLLAENTSFSFCIIDADKLKYANDNFGHSAGDEYLNVIAKFALSVSRSSDVVCRLGGDEYAIIFIGCSEDVIVKKMEIINEKLFEMKKDFPMSISYGVISIATNSTLNVQNIISAADLKMYEHKKNKKNK